MLLPGFNKEFGGCIYHSFFRSIWQIQVLNQRGIVNNYASFNHMLQFPQRRQGDWENIESIIQVLSEFASLIGPNLVFLPDYSAATIKPEFVVKVFADDCTEDIKKLVLDKHKLEPLAPFQGKVTLTQNNFGSIPKYYIETTKDVGVSTANQEKMIAANGTVKKVFKLDSGHSPYFAKPDELAALLNGL